MKIRTCLLGIALGASAQAQNWSTLQPTVSAVPAFQFQAQQTDGDHVGYDAAYRKGLGQLDAREWDAAAASFSASAAHKGGRQDAALYWKAYAQKRAMRGEAALLTVSQLRARYPDSKWLKDALALELEVRANAGMPLVLTNTETDGNLKLMAANTLVQSDPVAGLPVVREVLKGDSADQVKEQALFVLTQNPSPEADKLLRTIANGTANVRLQIKAIRLMGMLGGDDARKTLSKLYSSSTNREVKRAIIESFMQSGSDSLVLNAAKTESDPELRAQAIRQLAMTGQEEQLWQLYRGSSSVEDKKAILESMLFSRDTARLNSIAKSDELPELRKAAVRSIGMSSGKAQSDLLVDIFRHDRNADVRDAALNALAFQQNGEALIELAKQQKDPQVKSEIVSKMSLVQSRAVTDYLMELIK